MMSRLGRLRAMNPIERGMKVPEPTPDKNCIAKKAGKFGETGASRLDVKKTTMPSRRTRRTPKMPPK
jgi:hypothetical protein